MYIFIRTFEVADGVNLRDATQGALRIAEYLQRKQNLETKVTHNVGGPQNQIHWVVTLDSLDRIPAQVEERAADTEWQEILKVALPLIKPGSLRDAIHRIVD